jgi:hypothetical protein
MRRWISSPSATVAGQLLTLPREGQADEIQHRVRAASCAGYLAFNESCSQPRTLRSENCFRHCVKARKMPASVEADEADF